MNFLFVLDFFTPSKWWVERVFENIIDGIDKNNEIIVLTSRFSQELPKYEKNWNIQIYRIWKNRFFFTLFALFLWLKLIKNIDIIHTSTYNSAYVVYFLSFWINAKIILTSHEILWKNWYDFKWKVKWFFYKKVEDWIYKMWFNYVFVSNHVKNIAKISYNLENTKTIYNWLDKIKLKWNIKRKDLWFKETDVIGIFAGRPGWTKWLDFLLDNFQDIQKLNPNFKLLILLLEKNNKNKINNILEKTKNIDWIKILFEVEHNEVYDYMNISDIWIVPSRSEGFGYTALEFSALWKTSVLSNVGWIPEINFWDCHFFKIWDKQQFLRCFHNIFKWKKNNYWYDKKLTKDKMIEEYRKLYF